MALPERPRPLSARRCCSCTASCRAATCSTSCPATASSRRCCDRGFDVYLVDWGVPDELESGNTLETYTDGYIPTIVDARSPRRSGSPDVNLFGYCFGGVLSLLSRRRQPRPAGAQPGRDGDAVDMRHMGPMTSMMQEGRVEPEDLLDATGNVPADVMLNSFRVLTADSATSPATSTCGRTSGTTTSSPPTR